MANVSARNGRRATRRASIAAPDRSRSTLQPGDGRTLRRVTAAATSCRSQRISRDCRKGRRAAGWRRRSACPVERDRIFDLPTDGPPSAAIVPIRTHAADGWTPILPVPDDAPRAPPSLSAIGDVPADGGSAAETLRPASALYTYRNPQGRLLGYTARYDLPN